MAIFFTADTHFGHANIIKYCERPYTSVEEMDEDLIERWNKKVHRNDVVYHLGDFAFKAEFKTLFTRLNGCKHLIVGNHDNRHVKKLPWASVNDLLFLDGVILCHYPLADWPGTTRDEAVHLHGHTHGGTMKIYGRLDVGVDAQGNDYTPVAWEDAVARARNRDCT